jgi:hypothetical protein
MTAVPSQVVVVDAPEVAPPKAIDNILITKPINPTAPMPKRVTFIESQSSSLPGFTDSLSILAACCSQDFTPICIAHTRFHYSIINVAVTFCFKKYPNKAFKGCQTQNTIRVAL